MTHYINTNELIIKLMPSIEHQVAHICLANQFTYQLIQIGILYNSLLTNIAEGRCSGPNFSKEADTTYKPKCRNYKID